MRHRTTSYDKSYVGSSGTGLKSEILRKGELVIEKGIPAPVPSFASGRRDVWALVDAMEVGDSFLMPNDSPYAGQIAGIANRRNQPKRFTSRKEGLDRRIWRIA